MPARRKTVMCFCRCVYLLMLVGGVWAVWRWIYTKHAYLQANLCMNTQIRRLHVQGYECARLRNSATTPNTRTRDSPAQLPAGRWGRSRPAPGGAARISEDCRRLAPRVCAQSRCSLSHTHILSLSLSISLSRSSIYTNRPV